MRLTHAHLKDKHKEVVKSNLIPIVTTITNQEGIMNLVGN